MLVLSRKEGERILIGPDIELTIVDVSSGRVKLGFSCPTNIRVLREELHPVPRQTSRHPSVSKSTLC